MTVKRKSSQQKKKLVLFDIDGTLIRPLVGGKPLHRFSYAIDKAYGVQVNIDELTWGERYNGKSDQWIIHDLMRDTNVTDEEIFSGLDAVGVAFCEYFEGLAKDRWIYGAIPEARQLVDAVSMSRNHVSALLTGNLGASAKWKLQHAGYPQFYEFGVFGHEAKDRSELARLVMPKAKKNLGYEISARDIIIIGDTVHDVTCARVIGASVVAVSTGWNVDQKRLQKENPDLYVDSLMDKRIFALLGLKKSLL